MNENHLIQAFNSALQDNRKGQEALYQMFSGKMLYIAQSYIKEIDRAEDVVIESFYKAFTEITSCKNALQFGAWLRKILINKCIDELRKQRHLIFVEMEDVEIMDDRADLENEFVDLNLELLFEKMPEGYKIVFNLYYFEEKKHQEIAELLNINIGTSKSQLNKAKNWIRNQLIHYTNENI